VTGRSARSSPGIPRPKLFKDRHRAQLDTFGDGLTASGRDLVVGEARAAFPLSQAVFEDVAAMVARDAA
jgi:heme oxygenase